MALGLIRVRVLAFHRHEATASKVGFLWPLSWFFSSDMSALEKKMEVWARSLKSVSVYARVGWLDMSYSGWG